MDLFSQLEEPINILPSDGTALYYGELLPSSDADRFLEYVLDSIEWKRDEAIVFGKHITTQRKVAWYGEKPFTYTYSKITKTALPWTSELLTLKTIIEDKTNESFNSCLLNLYHNGREGMSWHSDAERDLQKNGAITSLSLGAERKFSFKHKKTKESVSLNLQHGSLLVMKGETQQHWLHCLPTTKTVVTPRVNLTFRRCINKAL
jgi:alkylated DNA repair dioxygenase AlkB